MSVECEACAGTDWTDSTDSKGSLTDCFLDAFAREEDLSPGLSHSVLRAGSMSKVLRICAVLETLGERSITALGTQPTWRNRKLIC